MTRRYFICIVIIFFLPYAPSHILPGFNVGRTTHYGNDGCTSIENTLRGTYVVYDKNFTSNVHNMTAYIRVDGSNHKVRLLIYKSKQSHYAGDLVGMTEERTINAGFQGWVRFNFSSPYSQLTSNSSYQFCIISESTTGDCFVYDLMATTGDEFDIIKSMNYTDGYPSNLSGESLYENRIDIYCTCTSTYEEDHISELPPSFERGLPAQ